MYDHSLTLIRLVHLISRNFIRTRKIADRFEFVKLRAEVEIAVRRHCRSPAGDLTVVSVCGSYREIGRRGGRPTTTVRGWDPGDPRSYLALISADLSPRSIPTTNRGFGLVCVYNAYVRGRYHLRRADRPPPKPTGGEGYRGTKVIKRTG